MHPLRLCLLCFCLLALASCAPATTKASNPTSPTVATSSAPAAPTQAPANNPPSPSTEFISPPEVPVVVHYDYRHPHISLRRDRTYVYPDEAEWEAPDDPVAWQTLQNASWQLGAAATPVSVIFNASQLDAERQDVERTLLSITPESAIYLMPIQGLDTDAVSVNFLSYSSQTPLSLPSGEHYYANNRGYIGLACPIQPNGDFYFMGVNEAEQVAGFYHATERRQKITLLKQVPFATRREVLDWNAVHLNINGQCHHDILALSFETPEGYFWHQIRIPTQANYQGGVALALLSPEPELAPFAMGVGYYYFGAIDFGITLRRPAEDGEGSDRRYPYQKALEYFQNHGDNVLTRISATQWQSGSDSDYPYNYFSYDLRAQPLPADPYIRNLRLLDSSGYTQDELVSFSFNLTAPAYVRAQFAGYESEKYKQPIAYLHAEEAGMYELSLRIPPDFGNTAEQRTLLVEATNRIRYDAGDAARLSFNYAPRYEEKADILFPYKDIEEFVNSGFASSPVVTQDRILIGKTIKADSWPSGLVVLGGEVALLPFEQAGEVSNTEIVFRAANPQERTDDAISGAVCRLQPDGSHYQLGLRYGYYQIAKVVRDGDTLKPELLDAGAFNPSGFSNHMLKAKAVCDGETLQLYAAKTDEEGRNTSDYSLIASVSDASFSTGRVGLGYVMPYASDAEHMSNLSLELYKCPL